MKTTLNLSKASEAKPTWVCYAIWWLDALALLVIMLGVSVCRAFQERRVAPSDEADAASLDHDFTGLSATV